MKYFKDTNNQVFAYEADGSQDAFIKPNLTPITFEEAQALTAPPPLTLAEQFEAVRVALQNAINNKAWELGKFTSGDALIQYAGFPNAFQSLALQFGAWEVSVWTEAEAYRQLVINNLAPMVFPDQAVVMMPEYPT